jgi:hypothetical protein
MSRVIRDRCGHSGRKAKLLEVKYSLVSYPSCWLQESRNHPLKGQLRDGESRDVCACVCERERDGERGELLVGYY